MQEHIEDLIAHQSNLEAIKSTLHSCYQIDVSYIESINDLQPSNLANTMIELQRVLDLAMERYKT
ncbi:hypothetical protein DXX93_18770 [Thalassotalea euphylliae]|uniref:Uncharacterized protein n=1 Tax=Thalassotalea euphylliae TaxID=1655234 RepID=A0A3E0TVC7_9GAMM|nr:hypothetical protein DXX93_18770 [Thalassotalea euphylliae]